MRQENSHMEITDNKNGLVTQSQSYNNDIINMISPKMKNGMDTSSYILNKMLFIEKVLSSEGNVNKSNLRECKVNSYTNMTLTKIEIDDIEGIKTHETIVSSINRSEEEIQSKPNKKRVKCLKRVIFVLLIIILCVFLHFLLSDLIT